MTKVSSMKIYKYTSLDGALGILYDQGVKLSNPIEFNDVFDCRFEANKEQNIKGFAFFKEYAFFKIAVEEIFKGNLSVPNINVFKKEYTNWLIKLQNSNSFEIEEFMKIPIMLAKKKFKSRFNKTQRWFDDIVHRAIEDAKKHTLIACFSKRKDSLLMWSHYADSHKGVCFEFDYESTYFYDVKYEEQIPSFDVMAGLKTAIASSILKRSQYDKLSIDLTLVPFYTKSSEWEYEQEVRGIYHSSNSKDVSVSLDCSHYYLPMPKPTRVYIGCRADNSNDDNLSKKLHRFIQRAKRLQIEIVFLEDSNAEYKLIETEKEYSKQLPSSPNDLIIELANNIDNCFKINSQFAALSTAFLMISICANAYLPNADEKQQFVTWIDDYLMRNKIDPETGKNISPYLSSQLLWDLKERFTKYGDFNISGIYDNFRLDFIKVKKEKIKTLNIIINDSNSNDYITGRNYITFNILSFCIEIKELALTFYKKNKDKFNSSVNTNIEDRDRELEDLRDCVPWGMFRT